MDTIDTAELLRTLGGTNKGPLYVACLFVASSLTFFSVPGSARPYISWPSCSLRSFNTQPLVSRLRYNRLTRTTLQHPSRQRCLDHCHRCHCCLRCPRRPLPLRPRTSPHLHLRRGLRPRPINPPTRTPKPHPRPPTNTNPTVPQSRAFR